MSRSKKGFGLDNQTLSAAELTVKSMATNSSKSSFLGGISVTLVDIKEVEPDPTNPRILSIKKIIQHGLRYDSPSYQKEKNKIKDPVCVQELENLEQLALSIKTNGLLNSIVVRKINGKFKLIAGERRFLACSLLGLDSISVKIISRNLNELDIKLLQWAENHDREDLTPCDRLNNVRQIVNAYKKQTNVIPSSRKLAEIMRIQKSQSARYLLLLKQACNSSLMKAIDTNKISSLKTAEYIATIEDMIAREKILALAIDGTPIKDLKITLMTSHKSVTKSEKTSSLNLRLPDNLAVNKLIFEGILNSKSFQKYNSSSKKIDWDNYTSIKNGWKNLIKHAEHKVSNE